MGVSQAEYDLGYLGQAFGHSASLRNMKGESWHFYEALVTGSPQNVVEYLL
jgi:hypothetical protein